MRQNRRNKVPLKSKAAMEKKNVQRGYAESAYLDDIEMVAWKDNRPVYVASNKFSGASNIMMKKWSRAEKKTVQVPVPESVLKYNSAMGGVDLMDQMIAKYRSKYR